MAEIIKFPEKLVDAVVWLCNDCGGTEFQLRLHEERYEGVCVCSKCFLTTDFYWGYKNEAGLLEVPPID